MSNSTWDYLNDHAAAGHCAYSWYHRQHDNNKCPEAAGTCAVIGFLVGELMTAEQRNSTVAVAKSFDPLRDTPPGGWQPAVGSGGTGDIGWQQPAEVR